MMARMIGTPFQTCICYEMAQVKLLDALLRTKKYTLTEFAPGTYIIYIL